MATWNRVRLDIGFLKDEGVKAWADYLIRLDRHEDQMNEQVTAAGRLGFIHALMLNRYELTLGGRTITETQEKEIGLILESLLFEDVSEISSQHVYQLISMVYDSRSITEDALASISKIKNPTLATDLFASMLTALEGDEMIAEKTQKLLKNMNALTASQCWNMVLDEDMQDPAFWNFIIENVGTNNIGVYQHIQLLANADYQNAREALPGIVYKWLVEYMAYWASIIQSKNDYEDFNHYLSSIKADGTIPWLVYGRIRDHVANDFNGAYGGEFDSVLQTAPQTKVDIRDDLKRIYEAMCQSPYYSMVSQFDFDGYAKQQKAVDELFDVKITIRRPGMKN